MILTRLVLNSGYRQQKKYNSNILRGGFDFFVPILTWEGPMRE